MVSMMKAPSKSPGACFERIMLGKQPRHPKWRRQNQVSNYWMIMKIRLEATGIYRASQPSKAFCQDARIQVFTGRFVITPVPTIAPHKLWTTCAKTATRIQSHKTVRTCRTPLLLYSATAHEGCRSNWPWQENARDLGHRMRLNLMMSSATEPRWTLVKSPACQCRRSAELPVDAMSIVSVNIFKYPILFRQFSDGKHRQESTGQAFAWDKSPASCSQSSRCLHDLSTSCDPCRLRPSVEIAVEITLMHLFRWNVTHILKILKCIEIFKYLPKYRGIELIESGSSH